MIDPEKGGEASAVTYVRTGELMLAGSVGAAVGAFSGALSTQFLPAKIQLDKGVDVKASFVPNKQGLIGRSGDDELGLPEAPISTPIPGFRGVKVELVNGNVVREVTGAIDNPKTVKKFTNIVAQPTAGAVEPIQEALTMRVAEGALAGALLLPFLGVALAKRLHILKQLHSKIPAKTRALAYPAAAVFMVGCGVGGDNIIQGIESEGQPLPAEIANRSPYLKNATVKGADLNNAVKKVVASYDKGQRAWKIIDKSLSTKLSDFERSGGLSYKYDPSKESRLYQDSALCNIPYIENVLPTVISKTSPSFFGDTGDRRTNGNTLPFENDCEVKILSAVGDRPSLFLTGNHDQAPKNDKVIARLINGVTHVTYGDPRSKRWGHSNPPLTQGELNKQIAEQGSKIAEVACEITSRTGHAPDVDVHAPEAGFEAGLSGCASTITSSHGIRHNDNKNTTQPILNEYVSLRGTVFQQLINITASGSVNNRSIYKGPGKTGGVVLAEYDKERHRFSRVVSILFKKDRTVSISTLPRRDATAPDPYMLNFVRQYSPTADRLSDIR